ncbi:hypothetical protein Tco_0337780 [Tanacetum coccineum]
MSSMKTITNLSKYGLHTRFMRSMNTAGRGWLEGPGKVLGKTPLGVPGTLGYVLLSVSFPTCPPAFLGGFMCYKDPGILGHVLLSLLKHEINWFNRDSLPNCYFSFPTKRSMFNSLFMQKSEQCALFVALVGTSKCTGHCGGRWHLLHVGKDSHTASFACPPCCRFGEFCHLKGLLCCRDYGLFLDESSALLCVVSAFPISSTEVSQLRFLVSCIAPRDILVRHLFLSTSQVMAICSGPKVLIWTIPPSQGSRSHLTECMGGKLKLDSQRHTPLILKNWTPSFQIPSCLNRNHASATLKFIVGTYENQAEKIKTKDAQFSRSIRLSPCELWLLSHWLEEVRTGELGRSLIGGFRGSLLVIWNPSLWSWLSSSPLRLSQCQQLSLHVAHLSPFYLMTRWPLPSGPGRPTISSRSAALTQNCCNLNRSLVYPVDCCVVNESTLSLLGLRTWINPIVRAQASQENYRPPPPPFHTVSRRSWRVILSHLSPNRPAASSASSVTLVLTSPTVIGAISGTASAGSTQVLEVGSSPILHLWQPRVDRLMQPFCGEEGMEAAQNSEGGGEIISSYGQQVMVGRDRVGSVLVGGGGIAGGRARAPSKALPLQGRW